MDYTFQDCQVKIIQTGEIANGKRKESVRVSGSMLPTFITYLVGGKEYKTSEIEVISCSEEIQKGVAHEGFNLSKVLGLERYNGIGALIPIIGGITIVSTLVIFRKKIAKLFK